MAAKTPVNPRVEVLRPDCRIGTSVAILRDDATRVIEEVAGGEGFEPPLTESESVVLPLDEPPVGVTLLYPKRCVSALGVLRPLSGLVQTYLFALHLTGIPGYEAGQPQGSAQ